MLLRNQSLETPAQEGAPWGLPSPIALAWRALPLSVNSHPRRRPQGYSGVLETSTGRSHLLRAQDGWGMGGRQRTGNPLTSARAPDDSNSHVCSHPLCSKAQRQFCLLLKCRTSMAPFCQEHKTSHHCLNSALLPRASECSGCIGEPSLSVLCSGLWESTCSSQRK